MTRVDRPANTPPAPPRLVLRVGFAGSRKLSEEAADRLADELKRIFQIVAKRLTEIAPGTRVGGEPLPRFARFYSEELPLIRLVTGLAEGADALADQALRQAICDSKLAPYV